MVRNHSEGPNNRDDGIGDSMQAYILLKSGSDSHRPNQPAVTGNGYGLDFESSLCKFDSCRRVQILMVQSISGDAVGS